MSRRQLLGGIAVLVVVATAVWYIVVAPSRGSGVAPDASVRVVVSATAAGTGTWVRYLVTVKNLADGDFAGDVLLVDHDQDVENALASRAPATLPQSPRLPSAPSVANESAYQVHLTVPSRTSRTVAILAPGFFNLVEAVMGGTQLAAQPVERAAVVPVAVLSGVEAPADAVLALRFGGMGPRVAQFSSAREFPASALPLAGYAALVIDQFDSASLDAARVQAIRDFVGFGGTLVLGGGSAWQRTVGPLPTELLPIRPSRTASASLAPLAALTGAAAPPRSAPVAVGDLAPGARHLLDGPDGLPLAAEAAYGAGTVVQLAYDPSGDGAAGSPYEAAGWSQAVARGIDQTPGSGPMAASLLGADAGFTGLLPEAGDAPLPPAWLLGIALLAYLALVGPLGYLLATRRLGRPALFWAVVPLVAVAWTGTLYLTGTSLQGSLQDHEIQVVRIGAGSVNVLEYHRVLFLRRGEHQIAPGSNVLVAPLTLETFRTTGSACERCTSQLGGLPSGAERVDPDLESPTVDESGVVYGSVRVVAASGVARTPAGVDAKLSVRGGRLVGTVTNHGPRPVVLLQAFTTDGQTLHRAPLAPSLPAGAGIAVDSALGSADGPTGASPAADVLLRSVAATSIVNRGEVVLVGLMEPLPSRLTVDGRRPPLAGIGVLEQSVRPQASDGTIRDLQRRWLAASSGDPKAGYSDVYDLLVPPPSGPLALTFDAGWTPAVEVYDWTRGAFVPGPATRGADASQTGVPLTADQVGGGMVRVRLHEPRVSWGATLSLDAAGG
jgi:hypothetical protein